jgi:DNA-binding transcriptional LysR family regulator
MDRLEAMQALATVCEVGSFSAAGRRLHLSASAITRLIAGLERQLGVQLLHRTTRSLRLTAAGEAYLPLARATLEQVAAAEHVARTEQSAATTIRITAPLVFGRLHAGRLLAAFAADHSGTSVELLLSNDHERLIEQGVDLAIRIGALPDSSLRARRLGHTPVALVASPGYLADAGTPQTPQDLERHRLVGSSGAAQRQLWRFGRGANITKLAVEPVFFSDNAEGAIAFALAGGGIASVLRYQIAAELDRGALVEVLSEFSPDPIPVHAVMPGARLVALPVRALVDRLVKERGSWLD